MLILLKKSRNFKKAVKGPRFFMEVLVDTTRAQGVLFGSDSKPAVVAGSETLTPAFNPVDEAFGLIAMLADLSKLKSNLDADEVKRVAAHIAGRTNGIAQWLSERYQVNNPFTLHGFVKDPIGSLASEEVIETIPEDFLGDILELRNEHMAEAAAVFPDFRSYLAMLDRNTFQIRENDFVAWVTRPTS